MHTDDHSEVLTALSLFFFFYALRNRDVHSGHFRVAPQPQLPSTSIFQYLWQLETQEGKKNKIFESVPVWGPFPPCPNLRNTAELSTD
jgi:hypothetical protein